jgi:hypothetical protein
LVGLPLTSGPIIFFIVLAQGPSFARATAIGTLSGALSQALFCLVYAQVAARQRWPVATSAGVFAFFMATVFFQSLTLPVEILFAGVVMALLGVVRLMPKPSGAVEAVRPLPKWDIPARMILATTYVVALTTFAPVLGPRLTGLLSPFPLYALILAAFAHHLRGAPAASKVLDGLVYGLFGFASFFLILALFIEHWPVMLVFALAITVTLAVQGAALWWLNRVKK